MTDLEILKLLKQSMEENKNFHTLAGDSSCALTPSEVNQMFEVWRTAKAGSAYLYPNQGVTQKIPHQSIVNVLDWVTRLYQAGIYDLAGKSSLMPMAKTKYIKSEDLVKLVDILQSLHDLELVYPGDERERSIEAAAAAQGHQTLRLAKLSDYEEELKYYTVHCAGCHCGNDDHIWFEGRPWCFVPRIIEASQLCCRLWNLRTDEMAVLHNQIAVFPDGTKERLVPIEYYATAQRYFQSKHHPYEFGIAAMDVVMALLRVGKVSRTGNVLIY